MKKYRIFAFSLVVILLGLLIYFTVKDEPGTWAGIGGIVLFIYFAVKGREQSKDGRDSNSEEPRHG